MDISISNIAWEKSQEDEVINLLKRYNINYIDIAPNKLFHDIHNISLSQIESEKRKWEEKGFSILALQSLFYNTNGLNLFGGKSSQRKMLEYLENLCIIADNLDARRLVFGSPRNRDKGNLSKFESDCIALPFFSKAGEIAKQSNVILCIEANPIYYNCNYLTTTKEVIDLVEELNHPNIKVNLDTGCILSNKENIYTLFNNNIDLVGYIHISEPHLVPVGSSSLDHSHFSNFIRKGFSDPLLSIEMLNNNIDNPLRAIEDAIKFVFKQYKN